MNDSTNTCVRKIDYFKSVAMIDLRIRRYADVELLTNTWFESESSCIGLLTSRIITFRSSCCYDIVIPYYIRDIFEIIYGKE